MSNWGFWPKRFCHAIFLTAFVLVLFRAGHAVPVIEPGSTVIVSVSGGPGNPGDWVGLYRVGVPSEDFYQLAWAYLGSGNHHMPSTGTNSAKLTFILPKNLSPGQYEFRFYPSDVFTPLLATSTFIVGSGGSGTPKIDVTPLQAGSPETISVSGGPGNPTDWVGLFRIGTPSDKTHLLAWSYLNGTQVTPSTGTSAATFSFAMPSNLTKLNEGQYEFRFFVDDGDDEFKTPLAASRMITVGKGAQIHSEIETAQAASSIEAGGSVTVSVSGGPGNKEDFVGLFRVGAPAANFYCLAFAYLSGTHTYPDTGTSTAKFKFILPKNLSSGQYEFRFYANDQLFTLLATSNTFTVGSGGSGMPEIAATPLQAGNSETITVSDGPGNRNDWVGLFRAGAPGDNNNLLAWSYLNGTQKAPSTGTSSATFNFAMPSDLSSLHAGLYEFRFFANDDFQAHLANSQAITVGPGAQIHIAPQP